MKALLGKRRANGQPVTPEWLFSQCIQNENGCLEWQRSLDHKGYGKVFVDGKCKQTHRISWELSNGTVPNGMNVLHKCDNRKCINPSHLFLGTLSDNTQDMIQKGRNSAKVKPERVRRGENHGRSKLTWEQVGQIRNSHASGSASIHSLSKTLGMNRQTIRNIIRGKTWKGREAQ